MMGAINPILISQPDLVGPRKSFFRRIATRVSIFQNPVFLRLTNFDF
jgi:hypothetical protein